MKLQYQLIEDLSKETYKNVKLALKLRGYFYFTNTGTFKIDAAYYRVANLYNKILNIGLTARKDWSSALQADRNSFVSYSTQASFVFTEFEVIGMVCTHC